MAAASRGSVELCRALLSTGSSVDDVTAHVTFREKQLQKNKLQETRAGTHAVHEAAKGAHLKVLQVSVRNWSPGHQGGGGDCGGSSRQARMASKWPNVSTWMRDESSASIFHLLT